ncbi:MAG: sigma 54-interacting transcriptional regulator [Pseudomonadota bacterium]
MSRKALLIVDHDRDATRRVRDALMTVTGQAIEGTTPSDAMVRLHINEYSSVLLCESLSESERSELWLQISQQATPPRVVCIGCPANARPYSHYTVFQPLLLPVMPEPAALARSLRLKPLNSDDHLKQTAMSLRLVGKSEAVLDIRRMIERHSQACTPVLIMGERGTGKRLIARQIHDASRRCNGPFVSVDCAALAPEAAVETLLGRHDSTGGVVGQAAGGTLLLRNLAALPLEAQEALADVLDSCCDASACGVVQGRCMRIVATTNRNLLDTDDRNHFCEQLRRYLEGFAIHVPPLRERLEDIPLMIAHVSSAMRQRSGTDIRFSTTAMHTLMRYRWPGNQQQLLSMLQKLAALGRQRVLGTDDLPAGIRAAAPTHGPELMPTAFPPVSTGRRLDAGAVHSPLRGTSRNDAGRRRHLNSVGIAAKIAG